MLIDLRELDNDQQITADVCIIGGGAAGIAIAREFIGTSTDVCMIESGNLEAEGNTQLLYNGENVGLPYSLIASRLRFLGGSTNHWGGISWPLSEIDFRERSWVPNSGWPLDRETLEPYYERAQPLCDLGPFIYDDRLWEHVSVAAPDFRSSMITTPFWQEPMPTRFGVKYRTELEQAGNIKVLLNANVTSIDTTESGSAASHVEVRTLEGNSGRVDARRFVLACGGIENARILLLSNRRQPAGLGNQHDLVGRYFMDHPHVLCGTAQVEHASVLERAFWARSQFPNSLSEQEDLAFRPGICVSEELQQREQILNTSFRIYAKTDPDSGVGSAAILSQSLKRGGLPDDLGTVLWNITRDLSDVIRSATGGEARPDRLLEIFARTEAAPNPESRVTLSQDVDSLGLRRTRLEWKLSEIDKRSLKVSMLAIAQEFGRLNLARVKIRDWLTAEDAEWAPDLVGGSHHMGTTRMSSDPLKGVVDEQCRVHGVSNLYVAGSSVFPTSGYANPTLTLLALALRLADHLKI